MTKLGRKRVQPSPTLPRTAISTPPNEGVSATGTWRTYRPVVNSRKCTKCLTCWLYCPEGSVKPGPDSAPEIDLRYCKGCGICARECPMKAITMKFEGEMKDAEKNSVNR